MYTLPARPFLLGVLAFLLTVHAWALVNAGYFYVWWLDIVLHFAGGFWLASLLIFFLWKNYGDELPKRRVLSFAVLVSMAALGGIFWEFFEFGYDTFFGGALVLQFGQGDTMSDLFLDILGAGVAHFIFLKNNKSYG